MTGVWAGTEAGARASKTVLKILCKSSLKYLGILVAATETTATGGFVLEGPAGYLETPDFGGGEESGGVTEGATEKCYWQRRLRPETEVILV